MIWPRKEAEYFSREVWTGQITLELFGKLIFRRNVKIVCKRANVRLNLYKLRLARGGSLKPVHLGISKECAVRGTSITRQMLCKDF